MKAASFLNAKNSIYTRQFGTFDRKHSQFIITKNNKDMESMDTEEYILGIYSKVK